MFTSALKRSRLTFWVAACVSLVKLSPPIVQLNLFRAYFTHCRLECLHRKAEEGRQMRGELKELEAWFVDHGHLVRSCLTAEVTLV